MILVGATVAAWKCRNGEELDWLRNAETMREASPVPLRFFCAAQTAYWGSNSDDIDAMDALTERMHDLEEGNHSWFFAIDGWAPTTRERLIGITTGRNLIREHALRDTDATHVLFLDTDVTPPADAIPKLLELDHPVVGGEVPSYCLTGEWVSCNLGHLGDFRQCGPSSGCRTWDFKVQEHWNTAGFLLVRRDVLAEVAWRWDPTTEPPTTDDPCFARDVERAGFGRTWVRKDVVGRHVPLVPVEAR